jgi:serine/threonine-protein kinase
MDPAMDLGRYRLGRLLTQSVMGEVYRAVEIALAGNERPVVVRIFSRGVTADGGAAALLREVGALYRSPHDNLVAVRELGRAPATDQLFVATDWIDGPSLAVLLARLAKMAGQPMPLRFGLSVAVEIARGLEHLHTLEDPSGAPLRACHGELDPTRVLLSRRGEVKVAGLGLGHVRPRAAGLRLPAGSLTIEQARGEPPEPRSDLFALGSLLYQMLTGRHPFEADRVAAPEVLARIEAGRFTGPRAHQPGLPESLEAILRRAMAARVDDRYASAGELREDLEGLARREGHALSSAHLGGFVEEVVEQAEPLSSPRPGVPSVPRRSGTHAIASQKSFDAALGEQLASLHHEPDGPLRAPPTVAAPRLQITVPDPSAAPPRHTELERPARRVRIKLIAAVLLGAVSAILGIVLRHGRAPERQVSATLAAEATRVSAVRTVPPPEPVSAAVPMTAEADPRGEAGAPRPARLSVSSDVVANVFVDGKFVHATPIANLRVTPGRHVVRLEGDRGGLRLIPREETVLLRPGEERHLAMELR